MAVIILLKLKKMKVLVLMFMICSINEEIMSLDKEPQLREVVEVFFQEQIISKAIRDELNNEITKGKVNSTATLFTVMEDLSFSSLPDSSRAYFLPENYIVHPLPGMFDSEYDVPEGFKTVVDYLYSRLIIGEKCRDSLYEQVLKPSYGLDQFIKKGILKHTFIGVFNKIEMCSS